MERPPIICGFVFFSDFWTFQSPSDWLLELVTVMTVWTHCSKTLIFWPKNHLLEKLANLIFFKKLVKINLSILGQNLGFWLFFVTFQIEFFVNFWFLNDKKIKLKQVVKISQNWVMDKTGFTNLPKVEFLAQKFQYFKK